MVTARPDTNTADPKPDAAIKTDETAAIAAAAVAKAGEYTVAPNRTVVTADGSFGPGQAVNLDDKDAKRFRDLGFLLTDGGAVLTQTDGPAVNVENGIQVTTART